MLNWEEKRICVTGGAGFLGSYLIKQLEAQGAKDIFVPTIENYNLVDGAAIKRMLDDFKPGCDHPPGCPCGWDRCKPGSSG